MSFHPSVQHLLQFFEVDSDDETQIAFQEMYRELAHQMAHQFTPTPELSVSLRKLLEARDGASRCEPFPE